MQLKYTKSLANAYEATFRSIEVCLEVYEKFLGDEIDGAR